MFSDADARRASGATAYGSDGEKIGKVGQVFLDDHTGQPEFVTVNTGMFGTSESFVPTEGADFDGDDLRLAFTKDRIKDAPKMNLDGDHLDQAEEDRLFTHYGMGSGTSQPVQTSGTDIGTGTVPAAGTGYDDATRAGSVDTSDTSGTSGTVAAGHDTSGPTTDEAMTRSEEHLEAGVVNQESGRARLRKYVTTDTETVSVPVRKERAVLESEPITDANIGDAANGPAISEEEHEVVLHEERAVVDAVATPVERIRMGKETEVQEESVTGEVRKENVELDGDDDLDRPRH